jgi:hypothetical protein
MSLADRTWGDLMGKMSQASAAQYLNPMHHEHLGVFFNGIHRLEPQMHTQVYRTQVRNWSSPVSQPQFEILKASVLVPDSEVSHVQDRALISKWFCKVSLFIQQLFTGHLLSARHCAVSRYLNSRKQVASASHATADSMMGKSGGKQATPQPVITWHVRYGTVRKCWNWKWAFIWQ